MADSASTNAHTGRFVFVILSNSYPLSGTLSELKLNLPRNHKWVKDETVAIFPSPTLMDEITDFLLMNPSLEQIIAYKPSEVLDKRLHELLDKNTNDGLTPDE